MLKLLDYGKPNPFGGIIGRSRNLAWPVNVYRVTLPRSFNDSDGLNPFERVILKLLDATGTLDALALADETRIPPDLVKSILLRLRDKALIDEHNAIIKQERNSRENKEEKVHLFVTALLFRELATGKILPFLHFMDDMHPLQKKEGEEKLFRLIRWDAAHKQNTPTPRDIISALRIMKKRSANFGKGEIMPTIKQITIARSPEAYLLDCPIAIQKNEAEFRIADPFGNGFSLALERSFEQLLEWDKELEGWLHRWKQSLHNPRSQKLDAISKEPFDNDTNWQRYPKLIANLRPSKYTKFRSIMEIHASIEWALFYVCCRCPFEAVITKFKLTAQAQHPELLANGATNIGLILPQSGFRSIKEGKLVAFQNEKASLETVLAIAILQASDDASHPLHRIVKKYPDLIQRLLDIKKKRDEKGHGKGGADAPKVALADDPFMCEFIHSLLPDIVFTDIPVAELGKDVRVDSLLDARASIQIEFGFKTFNRLGTNLQDRLIHAERFWLDCKDGDNAIGFACDLYAAMQAFFYRSFQGKLPPYIKDSDLVASAREKALQSKLGDLPNALSTVIPLAIRQALQGSGPTLSAYVLAFLLLFDIETLSTMADVQPSFMLDMADIITKRGHGNEPLPLSRVEIAKLRRATFSTIKTLTDI